MKDYKKSLERELGPDTVNTIKLQIEGATTYDPKEPAEEEKATTKHAGHTDISLLTSLKKRMQSQCHYSPQEEPHLPKRPKLTPDGVPEIYLTSVAKNTGRLTELALSLDADLAEFKIVRKTESSLVESAAALYFYRNFATGALREKDYSSITNEDDRAYYVKLDKNLYYLAEKNNYTVGDIYKLYHQLSASITSLQKYLDHQKVSLWTEFEDQTLQQPLDSAIYQQLLKSKTPEEIDRRRYYLGLNSDDHPSVQPDEAKHEEPQ